MLQMTNTDVYGLDIGTSAIKMVALRKGSKGYVVTAAGISHIIKQNDGQSVSDTSIVRAIQDCFASARLRAKNKPKTRYAVCGASGPELAIRDFEFPPLPEEEVVGAVFFEASLVCPFNLEQAAVDYQLLPVASQSQNNVLDAQKTRGILVAATNNLLANKVRLAKSAGLKCVLMDVDGLALLNCFSNFVDENQRTNTAILNVGGSCATVAIINEDGWPFIRDINCAADYIISQIKGDSDISIQQILQVLFENSQDNQAEIEGRMEKACVELVSEIGETLRFYAAGEKSKPVNRIFVCGGFATAKGFVELLARRLGIEVCLWNPLQKLQCNVSEHCKEIFTKSGPAMAVATGLAMRSIETAERQ